MNEQDWPDSLCVASQSIIFAEEGVETSASQTKTRAVARVECGAIKLLVNDSTTISECENCCTLRNRKSNKNSPQFDPVHKTKRDQLIH